MNGRKSLDCRDQFGSSRCHPRLFLDLSLKKTKKTFLLDITPQKNIVGKGGKLNPKIKTVFKNINKNAIGKGPKEGLPTFNL